MLRGIFVHVKSLQSEKAEVQAKGSYSLPQKTLAETPSLKMNLHLRAYVCAYVTGIT